MAERRWSVLLALVYLMSVVMAWFIGSAGPVYWDSFGYVQLAIDGGVSGLGVGRPLFSIAIHLLGRTWLEAGGSVWDLEAALRYACLLVSALSAPLAAILAARLGLTQVAAAAAGGFVAFSPAFAHTAATVLTDGPALPLVLLSFVALAGPVERLSTRRIVWAAAWFGLALGVREASVFSAVTHLVLLWRVPTALRLRALVVFGLVTTVVVALPMLWATLTQPAYFQMIQTWRDGLAYDADLKTWTWREFRGIGGWLVSLGPVALVLSLMATWKALRRTAAHDGEASLTKGWLPLAASGWIQFALAALFVGATYSPRYLLPAMPLALAIPAGWLVGRWATGRTFRSPGWHATMVTLTITMPLFFANKYIDRVEEPLFTIVNRLPADLATVPSDAWVVTGHACPAIPLIRRQAWIEPRYGLVEPQWREVCPGWGWPRDLKGTLDAARAQGRTVVLDLRPLAWRGEGQQRTLEEVRAYADQAGADRIITWREP